MWVVQLILNLVYCVNAANTNFFPKLPSDLVKLEILLRAADLSVLEPETSIFIDLVQKSEGFLQPCKTML